MPMTTPGATELSAEVSVLMARRPVFDAHADSIGRALDLGHDLGQRGPGHLDLVRGQAGGLGTLVTVCWVDPEVYAEGAFERAGAMFQAAHDLAARHPSRYRLVSHGEERAEAHAQGKVAGILGIEGGHAIEGDLDKLHWFFNRGLRVMTLVWNNHLHWIRSCQDGAGPNVPEGLSEYGRQIVGEMNWLGILVDVSHTCEAAFYDVLEASSLPVIASHSGCRALHDHPRNLTDDQLRFLGNTGGVVGIVFHPGFLDAEARAAEGDVRESAAYHALQHPNEAQRFLDQQELMQRTAPALPAERLVDHVMHAVEVAGIDHVGIGSDYDGVQRTPAGLEDASCYGVLAELLLRRGLDLEGIEKILGRNMERVFHLATGPAAVSSLCTVAPMETPAAR